MKSLALALVLTLTCLAAPPEIDKGKAVGNPTARVRIEIFSDYACPACKTFHEETLPTLLKEFAATGKVQIVSREFPLNIPAHRYSREAAAYATAAAKVGKYDAVASALFHSQEAWNASGKVWETVAAVLTPEQQKKVQVLAKDPAVLSQVQADVNYGTGAGINGTPTLILSNASQRYPVSGYALNYNLLKSMINDLSK